MNDDQQPDRLHQLIELLVDGTFSAEQHDELQSLLKDNPDAQSAYFESMDLHVGLQKLTAAEPADEQLPPTHRSWIRKNSAGPSSLNSGESSYDNIGRLRSITGLVAALAVVVLLITVLPAILDNDGTNSQQAGDPENDSQPGQSIVVGEQDDLAHGDEEEVILTQAAAAELFGEFLPSVGKPLEFHHEYALIAGLIELRFPDGAEVILEAPSVIEITGRERLLVSAGNCSVHAPPGAEGFQVETPQTEITDLGTRFSVSVSEVGETDVQVVEGLAEVVATRDGSAKPIRLSEREARRFDGDVESGPHVLEFNADGYRNTLPDRVVSYEVGTTDEGYAWDLRSVTVQRDGLIRKFPLDVLIGVKVIHFRGGKNNLNVVVPVGYDGDRLAGLESDPLLHTGLINPGGSTEPLRDDPVLVEAPDGDESTPGMALQFREAIVNRPGPDVVFFELQTVTNPLEGDAFHVSPLRFEDGLHSQTIRRYDITMTSRQARLLPDIDCLFFKESALSLESLLSRPAERRLQTLRFRALAVGIDLSDLGYDDDASVDGLFFQDVLDDGNVVDPVFVAGLP